MFMLNFLFDFNEKSGAFSGDRRTPGSGRDERFTSKNWLKLIPTLANPEPGDPFPPTFDPETATWVDLGDIESGSIIIPKSAAPDDGSIGIRIAPDPDSTFLLPLGPTGAELTLAVCFGRPTQARQLTHSPFVEADGTVLTTFVFSDTKTNTTLAGGPVGWFFPLARVTKRPKGLPAGGKHQAHSYEFSVGVKVKSGGVTRHYGQDPQMDIGQ